MPLSSWIHPTRHIERLYLNGDALSSLCIQGSEAVKIWFEEGPDGAAIINFKGFANPENSERDTIIRSIREHLYPADITLWRSLKALMEPHKARLNRADEAEELDPKSVKLHSKTKVVVNGQGHRTVSGLLAHNALITLVEAEGGIGDFEVFDKDGNRLIILILQCNNKNDKTDFEISVQETGEIFDKAEKLRFQMSQGDASFTNTETIGVVILEGDVHGCCRSFLVQQVDGVISYLVAQRLSVIPTYNVNHSATVIARLTAAFIEVPNQKRISGLKKPDTLQAQRALVIASLPGISEISAAALLKTFGTLAGIVKATETELKAVKGIGPKRARIIKRVLCGEV